MYESPVNIITKDIQSKFENGVMTYMQDIGIYVDKGELVKALAYDRDQYEKGYREGRFAAESKTEWISVEDSLPRNGQYCFVAYVYNDNPEHRGYGTERYYIDEGNGYVSGPHFGNEGVYGMRVTHWMPIPEIPRLKGTDE